jgi:hypothetical protein
LSALLSNLTPQRLPLTLQAERQASPSPGENAPPSACATPARPGPAPGGRGCFALGCTRHPDAARTCDVHLIKTESPIPPENGLWLAAGEGDQGGRGGSERLPFPPCSSPPYAPEGSLNLFRGALEKDILAATGSKCKNRSGIAGGPSLPAHLNSNRLAQTPPTPT